MRYAPLASLLLTILVLFAMTSEAHAQNSNLFDETTYIGSVGIGVPQIDGLEDAWNPGPRLGIGVQITDGFLGIRGEVDIAYFSIDREEFGRQVGAQVRSGGNLFSVATMVYAMGRLPMGAVNPYAMLGGGFMSYRAGRMETSFGSIPGIEVEGFALGTGAGLALELRPDFGLFGETKYLYRFSGDSHYTFQVGARVVR